MLLIGLKNIYVLGGAKGGGVVMVEICESEGYGRGVCVRWGNEGEWEVVGWMERLRWVGFLRARVKGI